MGTGFKVGTTSKDVESLLVRKDIFENTGLWVTGNNSNGELGLSESTIVSKSSPTQVGSLTNWTKIAIGNANIMSIKTDGTIWAWGNNSSGNLGVGDLVHRSSPVQVGSLTNWLNIDCGKYDLSTIAIKTDGTLWAWGNNTYGQLGLNDTVHRSSPVQVGSLTNWKSVFINGHSIAIKTDGTLWSWGYNIYGQLGLNDLVHRSSPIQVGSLTNWKSIKSSSSSTTAIKTDGTLWAWGYNQYGQLGLNDITNRSSPVQVGALTNWKYTSTNDFKTTMVKTDGTLWTCGYNGNQYGLLGLNDYIHRSSPVQVGSLTNWKDFESYSPVTCAIKTDSTIWSWGSNQYGGLGLSDLVHRSSPSQIGSLTNWKIISCNVTKIAAISK